MKVGDRRLAAVMFTDLVGFTAHMQSDEADAWARRRRYVDAMNRYHQIHGGTVEKWLGDGALSTFASAGSDRPGPAPKTPGLGTAPGEYSPV